MVLPPSVALLNRVFLNCASKKGLLLAILTIIFEQRRDPMWDGLGSNHHLNYIFIFLFFDIFKAKLIEYLDSVKNASFFTFLK